MELKMQNDKAKFKSEFNKRLTRFSINIIIFCSEVRKSRNLYPIADQLIRSGTSIGANMIEAKASSTRREYLNYFQIALKSSNETKYWLYLLKETCSHLQKQSEILLNESIEISKIIASSIITMKSK